MSGSGQHGPSFQLFSFSFLLVLFPSQETSRRGSACGLWQRLKEFAIASTKEKSLEQATDTKELCSVPDSKGSVETSTRMELHGSADIMSFETRALRSLLPVLVLSLAIAFTASASSEGIDFSFPPFNNGGIQLQRDATHDSSGFIQITETNRDNIFNKSVGWATYYKPMRLWDKATGNVADFTSQFTFVINSQGSRNFTSGMTFFLVPNGSRLPDNSGGPKFAVVDGHRDPSNSSTSFVAVEFDTFHTVDGYVTDPNCPQATHIGIDLNNLNSSIYSCVDWFVDKIMSGGRINATITYNSSKQNLSVLMIDADAKGTDINFSAIYDRVNLTEYLPEWVTFGFSAAIDWAFELHTIEAWEFTSTGTNISNGIDVPPPANGDAKKSKLWLWFILGSGSLILLVFVLAFIWFHHHSKQKRTYTSGEEDDGAIEEEFEQVSGPKKFSYKDLVAATDNFAIERLLGEGGFGRVYEGYLTNVKASVAIKKISPGSRQGIKEYATEVKTISRLRHRNLVQLIGWCHEKKQLLLIYEFMSNGSLDSHLFKEQTFLPWEKRYKIAQGITLALLYLHEDWEQCVVHRDIKSSNIMLDSDFNAKLGDFGLARLVDHDEELPTTVLAGTMAYLAPEYICNSKASTKSDVYGFGIVLLEIACGRKAIEPRAEERQVRLVNWVWELHGTGRLLDAADLKLGTNYEEKQLECLMIVGLWCAHPNHTARPSMREALNVLNFNAPLLVLPSEFPVLVQPEPPSAFATASLVSSHATSTRGTKTSTITTSSVQYSASAASLPYSG